MNSMEYIRLSELTLSAVTGLDAIKRAPILDEETGLKCLRIQDISQKKEFLEWGNTKVSLSDLKKTKLRKNDILVARTGATVGVSYYVNEDLNSVFNNGTIRLRLDINKINPYLVYSLFQTKEFRTYIDNISCVATQPNLRINGLLRYLIPVFSTDIQTKITCVLLKYTELIDNNNRRIKLLEQIAEELYKEWFVRFRFLGYESVQTKIQNAKGWTFGDNENGQNIPESWSFGELKTLAEFIRGKNITSTEMIEGLVPVISAGLEPSGYHNTSNVEGYNLTISASGANAGYLSYHLEDIWAADCSYYNNKNNLWFVYHALKFLQPVIKNMQIGSAQPHVYAKNINRISTIIPSQELIDLFMEKVKPLYAEIRVLKQKNVILTKQRDSLLTILMSGNINLEDNEVI